LPDERELPEDGDDDRDGAERVTELPELRLRDPEADDPERRFVTEPVFDLRFAELPRLRIADFFRFDLPIFLRTVFFALDDAERFLAIWLLEVGPSSLPIGVRRDTVAPRRLKLRFP
jgi:hypothetical protein